MKTRSGFVSNSSSSSFVLVGIKVDYRSKEYNDLKNLFSNDINDEDDSPYEWQYPLEIDSLSDDGMYFFGKILATGGDSYLESGEFSEAEIHNLILEVSKKLQVSQNQVKLYFGERAC